MHPLDGPFLKLRRAKEHLKVVDELVEGIKEREPYRLVEEVVRNGQTREYILRFEQVEDVPPTVSLLIGDICNNLRSALDHLLWQLWLLKDSAFNGNVYFPICDSPDAFNEERITDYIKGLSNVQKAAIESLQPYETRNAALSLLRDVNNSDKHRLIQVIAFIGGITNLDVIITQPNGLVVPLQHISPQITRGAKIEDGTILARIPFGTYPKGSTMRVQSKAVINHVFEGSRTADRKPIKPSIDAMISEVSHAITLLEPEFSHLGTSTEKG